MKTINYDDWFEKYKPQLNHFTSLPDNDNYTFETFGEELEYVKKQNNKQIWTVLSTNFEESWIIPGYHYINRMSYYITEKKWKTNNIQVNNNEMIDDVLARIACLNFFFGENKEKYINKVSDYFTAHRDNTFKNQMTIGRAKYLAIEYYEHITKKEMTEKQENEIDNYYLQLI
jgi:hypothetical protein